MMPSAPTAQCSSAPPVNRLYMPSRPPPAELLLKNSVKTAPARPGIRTNAINRQTARMATVNKIRDFNSGILKPLAKGLVMERNMRQKRVQALAGAAGFAGAAGLGPTTSHAPPLASIFARADALNACALTVSFLVNSPSPRI